MDLNIKKTLLGIDLGTTSLKVSLFTIDGHLVASKSSEYPIITPKVAYAEQDPREWWQGFIKACQFLSREFPVEFNNVAGVGLCGQMHTQVYLDDQFQVLRPAITWMDQRAAYIVERINADPAEKQMIFEETSNVASTTYTATHVRWVIENQPHIWAQVRHILVAKDYLKFLLTGVMVTDYAEASGTLLFDVKKEIWSQKAFDYFGIPRDYFPEVQPSDVVIGSISEEAARQTGLPVGIPVVNGSSDNSASALGSGMAQSGQVTLILGTAGVITVCSDKPLADPQGRTSCWHYCLRDHWVSLGVTQTAGESLEWFKNAFDQEELEHTDSKGIFQKYNDRILADPEGCHGLTFLPYLNGERSPYWNTNARGVFFGINLKTTKVHFVRAIMEGVSFAFRNNLETVESLGININEVRAVGGGLKSQIWLEILGKVLRKPILTVSEPDTANLGNIMLCAKALGYITSYPSAAEKMIKTDREVFFPEGCKEYEKKYPLFLNLYESLKPNFDYVAENCED
jgi:xylulokinase